MMMFNKIFLQMNSINEFSLDFNIILWVATAIVIPISVSYAITYHFKHKVKTQHEKTWEKNRESVIWFCLSTIDNEKFLMKMVSDDLKRQNIDLSKDRVMVEKKESSKYSNDIEQQIERLPEFSNALGFITHNQYLAILAYLKNSSQFCKYFEDGVYEKFLLTKREKLAKNILELFPKEEEKHEGIRDWKQELN